MVYWWEETELDSYGLGRFYFRSTTCTVVLRMPNYRVHEILSRFFGIPFITYFSRPSPTSKISLKPIYLFNSHFIKFPTLKWQAWKTLLHLLYHLSERKRKWNLEIKIPKSEFRFLEFHHNRFPGTKPKRLALYLYFEHVMRMSLYSSCNHTI